MKLPSDQNASGRSLNWEEIELLREVIDSGTLISTKGTQVQELEERFAKSLGCRFASACSSGTAAVHAAVAAIDPEPGDEIITTPITDMGALTPILFQGAIPVFADVDPRTGNVTAETIAERLSDRTRAIIVTHLFGNPCQMEEIMGLAEIRGLPVIEDAAQAYGARCGDQPVGSIGAIGCFSLQQGKHMTTGEGGLIVTNDAAHARRIRLFVNKAWGYGDPSPDHYFLALNYRMTELQGAVGVAQLAKLDKGVRQRIEMAERLSKGLRDIPGLETPWSPSHYQHSYWRYPLLIDDSVLGLDPDELSSRLFNRGVGAGPHYIRKPAFETEIFQKQRTFGLSRYPFTLARPDALRWDRKRYPGTLEFLDKVLVLPWNEAYTETHVNHLVDSISETVGVAVRS